MWYYVNTDTIDIELKQIGIHKINTVNREHCIGIRHDGTKESVEEATRLAHEIAGFLNTPYVQIKEGRKL
jgi:hypothetical protein